MSEPKLISPLLDGFAIGAPLSDHDGVRCCPAMKENSDEKYIVKIISVPASQVQLEALLLAGAYKNPAEAMDYFKELAEGIVREAELLRKLSRLEGFLPYDGWQIVPMEDNKLGYQVYLVSPYKQSLEKFMRRNPMTHLAAVNLGLDLCAAMAICRRAGRVCVDLKPSNIFVSEDKEYRIGDLGFVSLKAMKYTALPSKYISAYTPPELRDPMSALNATADIYATGMILYQVYNNGVLPFADYPAAEVYPTPEYADYEMAEIIMKAIAPKPEDRWESPIAMGQALVAYMQRNSINDVPIVPNAAMPAPAVQEISIQSPEAPKAGIASAEETPVTGEAPAEVAAAESEAPIPEEEIEAPEEPDAALSEEAESLSHETIPLLSLSDAALPEPPQEDTADEEDTREAAPDEDPPEEKRSTDETVEVDLSEFRLAAETPAEEEPAPMEASETAGADVPKKKRGWLVALILGLVLTLLAAGTYVFYRYYYQQTIDGLSVTPIEDRVTVQVDTTMDTGLLTVFCTDIYGTTQQLPLTDGQAVFTDLQPDTQYTIHLEVEGFHVLVGSTNASFSTDAITTIPSFTAATGNEDGSVMLNFTVDGPDSEEWTVAYSTDGEAEQTMSFTGHAATVTGLTVGKTYRFTLLPGSGLYMVGENTLEFTASAIVLAEHLTIADYSDGTLTVTWNAPEGAEVESWIVRCYNDTGYSETLEVTETTAVFSGIDPTQAHNVEVAASGMTQSSRATMSANPTTITSVNFEESGADKLIITWHHEGASPDGGWLLMYSYDNREEQYVIRCTEPRAEISPRVPGATYHVTIQSASGTSIFSNTASYTCGAAAKFTDYDILVDYSTFNLCKAPAQEGWRGKDIPVASFTTTFAPGDKIGMVIKSSSHFIPRDKISAFYVIKDETGSVIHELLSLESDISWYEMWQGQYPYTGIEIPKVPSTPGNYTLELYWNFQFVASVAFTITE